MKKYRKVQAKHFQKKTLNPSKKNIAQKLYIHGYFNRTIEKDEKLDHSNSKS